MCRLVHLQGSLLIFGCFLTQIKQGNTDFFPKDEACCLGAEVDKTGIRLEKIQNMMTGLMQRFKDKVIY